MLYRSPYIRAYYHGAIRQIMQEHGIQPSLNLNHVVTPDAGFAEVVQHTYRFLVDSNHNSNPHYRYERYRELLGHITPSGARIAHIDIGCGAGLFSWAMLDWAKYNGVSFGDIVLYGMDHCPAMIDLARLVRSKLHANIADYPELHYSTNIKELIAKLTENHANNTSYTITLGHVLVQAHSHRDIVNFSRTIFHILHLIDTNSDCTILSADARGRYREFNQAWNTLLTHLRLLGILIEPLEISQSNINKERDAKIGRLYRPTRVFNAE